MKKFAVLIIVIIFAVSAAVATGFFPGQSAQTKDAATIQAAAAPSTSVEAPARPANVSLKDVGQVSYASIPEPSALALLLAGVAGVGFRRRTSNV